MQRPRAPERLPAAYWQPPRITAGYIPGSARNDGMAAPRTPPTIARQQSARSSLEWALALSPDAMLVIDHASKIILTNKQLDQLFGYAENELIGAPLETLVPERYREVHRRHVARYLAQPRPRPMGQAANHFFGRRRDGTEIPIEISLNPITLEQPCVVAALRDISHRAALEAALRASNERFRTIAENATDVITHHKADTTALYVSPSCRAVLGYEPEELVGHTVYEFMHPDERERFSRALQQALESKAQATYRLESRIRRKDGTYVWLESLARAHTAGGSTAGIEFIAVSRDVTARVDAEQEIRRLNDDLAKQVADLNAANEALDAFASSASHDLQGPLRGIDALSQALLEDHADRLDASGRESLQMIRRSTRHMSQLVADLLTFSRSARGDLRRQTVDLSALTREIVAELSRREPHRHVEFIAADRVSAKADAGMTRIVLENLLGNAWKFTAKTATPRIEFGQTRGPQGEPAYFVRDNGAGFDARSATQLFRPFQRLHTRVEFEGTGVGLATVRRIVERHGGRVWSEGAPGKGATFYFTLAGPDERSAR